MKPLIVFALLLLFPNSESKRDPISWSAARPLTWSDFKGKAPERKPQLTVECYNCVHAAYTTTELRSSGETSNGHAHFMVESVFLPDLSWVVPNENKNMYILEHEQLHFDIAECSARILRKELSQLTGYSQLNGRFSLLHDSIDAAWSEIQYDYDVETKHSMDRESQIKWNHTIDSTLTALEDFKDYQFSIELK